MQFPQDFIIRRELHAIQHFGQSLLEPISAGAIIRAERQSAYSRMIEAIWNDKPYLIFERDLTERTEPVEKPVEDSPVEPAWPSAFTRA